MSNSFQRMMAYDDYEMKKNSGEFKEKMHKEALKKRQHMQQCPVCKEYRDFVTNVHCVQEHGMTKKEVEAKYGKIVTGLQLKRAVKNKEVA